jgi:hypothetical protein
MARKGGCIVTVAVGVLVTVGRRNEWRRRRHLGGEWRAVRSSGATPNTAPPSAGGSFGGWHDVVCRRCRRPGKAMKDSLRLESPSQRRGWSLLDRCRRSGRWRLGRGAPGWPSAEYVVAGPPPRWSSCRRARHSSARGRRPTKDVAGITLSSASADVGACDTAGGLVISSGPFTVCRRRRPGRRRHHAHAAAISPPSSRSSRLGVISLFSPFQCLAGHALDGGRLLHAFCGGGARPFRGSSESGGEILGDPHCDWRHRVRIRHRGRRRL